MALYKLFKKGIFPLLVLSFLSACGDPRENKARQDMQEFETWMKEQSQKQKTWPEQEWQEAKRYYLEFEAEMEAQLSALPEESRQKYEALKKQFSAWEEEVNATQGTMPAGAQTAWQNKLLGQYADTAVITATNIRNAYALFLENVRQQYREWNTLDWKWTENVRILLDSRKDQLAGNIPVADEVAISALRAEYETLRAGDEVQDVVN